MKYFSLKTKMALAVSALFVTFVSLISFATLSYFEAEFRNTLAKEQFSLLSSIANNIEEKMKIAQNILVASAEAFPRDAITDPDSAQRFLDAQKGLLSLFDNGIFLLSKEGKLIAESPYRVNRRGRDISYREFYQQTVATKKPYISQPYLSTHHPGEPAIALTVPILDSRGELVVILQGSFDLLGTNIFADLLKVKNGQTGYLYLCDKSLMMIVHPNKDRILKPGQSRGANIMLDKAVDGFEGSGETVTSFGGKMFVTFKHVSPTGWILGSNYPMAEAYVPFYRARSYFIVGIIAMTALVLLLVWILMKRFTNPLLAITRHVQTLPSNLENYQALGLKSSDEIGALGQAFDSMATSLAIKERALQGSELNFRALAENANDGMLIAEKDGAIVYVNERIAEITGYESSELLALHMERLIAPEELQMMVDIHSAVFNGTEAGIFETALVRKDQAQLPVEVSSALTTWAGKIADLLVIRDISERKATEASMRSLEQRLALHFQQTPLVVIEWDTDFRVRDWNPAAEKVFGYSKREALGRHANELIVSGKAKNTVAQVWDELLIHKSGNFVTNENLTKDGRTIFCDWNNTPLIDESGTVIGVISLVQDVSVQRQTTQRIHYLAYFDELTGLPNRALFNDRLAQAIFDANRHGRLAGLMFLDLDQFKVINDTMGHAAGDTLLKIVAERLKKSVREGDTVARMGGDEFAILLEDISQIENAARIAQKILDAFKEPCEVDQRSIFATFSIGVTLFPLDGISAAALLKNADSAMYHAKEQGRNNFQFYSAEMTTRVHERFMLEGKLRLALERQEFVLHYQPQIDIKTGKIIGAEALIRWEHPELGTVSPASFIPLAEETGLIVSIGEWVLATACTQFKSWEHGLGNDLRLAVNCSSRQFKEAGFAARVKQLVSETGFSPSRLELEITESILIEQSNLIHDILTEFAQMGMSISIDDFGTGYSSLSYLRKFPINTLKIDRSFIHALTNEPEDGSLVKAIVAMARSMKLRVIAEGVETNEQLSFLRSENCDEAQGFLFAKPLPADEFYKLLANYQMGS